MTPFDTYLEAKKALDAQLTEVAKVELFTPFFTALFKAHPTIKAVIWSQYTPHFNDGDPCTFRVNEVFATEDAEGAADSFNPYDDAIWHEESSWDTNAGTPTSTVSGEVNKFLGPLEDVLHRVFGDGVVVKIMADASVHIEDHCHD